MSNPLQKLTVRDAYHRLLASRWRNLVALLSMAFAGINLLFALLYLAVPGSIHNARPGDFSDALFFSAQTLTTVGYGNLAPAGLYGNLVASLEAFFGLLSFALGSGLAFAKLSRPTANVLFSKVGVIATQNGVPSLLFRLANTRQSHILEAQAHAVLIREERTLEGEPIRRIHDLKLLRGQTPLFALSWTLVHPIDEHSPLWKQSREDLLAAGSQISITLLGMEATFSQTVHARHAYSFREILWGRRFVNILKSAPGALNARVDYTHFHDTVPEAKT